MLTYIETVSVSQNSVKMYSIYLLHATAVTGIRCVAPVSFFISRIYCPYFFVYRRYSSFW